MSSVFAGLLYLGVAVILLAHKKWDEGESFEAHGAYNMLVFLVIAVPLNVLLQLIILCQRRMNQKTFCRLMVMHVVAASILIVLLLMYYRSIWGNGSHGAHLKHGQFAGTELCEWDGVNLPFVDLLPNHSQNFWAGSSTCPQVTGIKAEWGHDGILTIQCLNKDKNLQPTYDILPDTKEWPTQEKIMHTYNKKIIERIEKRSYREPVLINDSGIEAIVANCEENISKVLIRVTSQEKVLDRVEAVQRARTKQKQDLISTVEQRALANSSQEEGLVDSKAVKYTKEEGERKPNVLVLFLDAVARRQFYRKLTKTAAVISDLTASTDEDSAQGRPQLHEFFRYHAVGLNTGANSRAIYTNHTEALVPVALPIWKVFHDAGYITSNVENSCYDWSTHYTGLTTSQYFDHELHTPFCLPPYFALTGNPFGNFVGPYSIVRRCLHGDNIHNHAFEYMTQFMQAYPDKPWFQLASFIEGHEGTGEVLLTVDHDLAKFIRGMEENGTLSNTIIFIMADHGLHMGINFMFTQNGRIEHMNPYLSVILPPLLTKNYPSLARGLRHNQQSLVTAYEIHATLKSLASGKAFIAPEFNGENTSRGGDSWRRGTLFDEELNMSRSCDQARIPEKYCKCRVAP
ncbi:hypothetical protein BGZ68_001431 [Mortierella alpina]|nr:hypothetical protein BGZ68_001431 [Mortierella alpina]